MIHPLIHLAASRPELLVEHGEAYAALVAKEITDWRTSLVRRVMLGAVAALGAVLSLLFIGIAVMLWASTPEGDMRSFGALLAVPGVMLALTLGAAFFAKGGAPASAFDDLKKQFSADLRMLREAKAKK